MNLIAKDAMNIERIAEGHVDETIEQATQPVGIDFWMDNCPACNMMAPKLKAVANAYEVRVKVYQVKVEESSALLTQYDVETMPTILFFSEGALVKRVEALVSFSGLERAFEEVTSAEAPVGAGTSNQRIN